MPIFNFIILIGCILLSTLCIANEKAEQISIVTEHLPPYQIVDHSGKVSGFATEIIHEVMARTNYQYQLNSYSWVRSYNLASVKENHCIYSIARNTSREKLFKWIGTITEVNNTVLWGLKTNKHIQINTIEDAKNYTIAVNKNDVTHLTLLEKGFQEGKHLYVLDDTESLIKLLASRPEIELIVADDITLAYRAELAGVDVNSLQRILELEDVPLNFYFACSLKTSDNIVTQLKDTLYQIHSDGTYDKILDKWRGKMSHINE